MPAKKEQTSLLVSKWIKDAIARIAVVRDESRAEASRAMLNAGLVVLGEKHQGALARLDAVAERMGLDAGVLAEAMLDDRIGLEMVEGWNSYPRLTGKPRRRPAELDADGRTEGVASAGLPAEARQA